MVSGQTAEGLPGSPAQRLGGLQRGSTTSLKPASDVEAAAPTTESSTPRELLMFLGFLAASTLVFNAWAWLAGVLLLGSPPSSGSASNHTDSGPVGVLKVLAVGSLVVALCPCAIILLIILRHGPLSQNSDMGGQMATRARARMRGPALVALVVFALCMAVGTGLTTYALIST